jgi:chemotaxis protein CheX
LLAVDLLDVTQSDIVDAVGELANVIGGNVKALLPQPCQLSLPHVQINGDSGWPVAIEVSRITGTWLDEPVTVSVLASQTQKEV